MSVIYHFDLDSAEDLLLITARNLKKRRLEKNISRKMLSQISGVSAATISKFENEYKISLSSFVALVKALGYSDEIKALLSQPKYNTMQELDVINKNKLRRRGRNENS